MDANYTIVDLQKELDAFGALRESATKEQYLQCIEHLEAMSALWKNLSLTNYGGLLKNVLWVWKEFGLTKEGLDWMDRFYPAYEKQYPHPNHDKAKIHEVWALLHIRNNDEASAYEHLKKHAYYTFVDNVDYSGFEFFSFRTFTPYALNDVRNNTLSLSHPRQFNDPMDTLLFHWNNHCLSDETDEEQRRVRFLLQKVYDHLKVRCFVRTSQLPCTGKEPDWKQLVNKEQNIEDVNPVMWAHYANFHKGFCIKYCFPTDILRTTHTQALICSRVGNVDYRPTMNMNEKDKLSIDDALFVKSNYWEYENEVRIVHYDPNCHEDYKLIELPDDCISSIYLGLKCNDHDREEMQLILRDKAIPLYQMRIAKDDNFKLVAERIS